MPGRLETEIVPNADGSIGVYGNGVEFAQFDGANHKFGYTDGGAITQATNASTGVTINTPTGQITTVALTTAAAAEETFTVTCAAVKGTDVVVLGTTYAGAGTPMLSVKKIVDGAFDVVITNVHASAALNAAMVINYVVLKGANS